MTDAFLDDDPTDIEVMFEDERQSFAGPDGGMVVIEIDPETGDQIIDLDAVPGSSAFDDTGDDEFIAFDANLADYLEESETRAIAADICEMIEIDDETREDWRRRMREGIRMLGASEEEKSDEPFPGASRVTHPVLAEAAAQFQARAIKELFPAKGPVKAKIEGDSSPEIEEQRERVQAYMNYQYTKLMPEAFWEMDQLLAYLPMSGSAFKKTWFDPNIGRVTTRFVMAEDLIVPYSASDLATAPRYTHRFTVPTNDLKKQMHSGFYRKIALSSSPYSEQDGVHDEIDRVEGRAEVISDMDDEYTLLECHIEYDLPGFEDIDDDDEPTGIGLPYIITIDRASQEVLSIRRNWREDDAARRKRVWFQHYKYLPGLGFYGHGLLHMIGGLAKAATGALRALLDSAAFSNLQGGFKTKDARTAKGGEVRIKPGHWVEVELGAEDLSKAFYRPPYAEPSMVLFNLLGGLVEMAQRFATTADAMVGDADNKGPVGTTLALIEQGSKVFSSIHKRLHWAQGEEFQLVGELNRETLEGQYDFNRDGASHFIRPEDFDGVSVTPVSDPNIFSTTQRIAQAQAALKMATEAPDLHNLYQAHKRMYEALEIEDFDSILIDPEETIRMDPITENMAFLHGKAFHAVADQHHAAHMMVHEQWFASLPPQGQKMMQGPFMAHMGEHMAHEYRNKMQAAMGTPLPASPGMTGRGPIRAGKGGELPPQIENQIAVMAAQAAQQMMQAIAPPQQPPPDPKMIQAQADAQRKDAVAQSDIKRKDAAAASDIQRKNMAQITDAAATDAKLAMDMLSKAQQPALSGAE